MRNSALLITIFNLTKVMKKKSQSKFRKQINFKSIILRVNFIRYCAILLVIFFHGHENWLTYCKLSNSFRHWL